MPQIIRGDFASAGEVTPFVLSLRRPGWIFPVMAADIFTPAKRSAVMSAVRGKGNKSTELRLVEIFRAQKITGWRRHAKVFGSPDIVFPKLKLAVFVDGCFWHGCPEHGTLPATNREFWETKITRNRERDREVNRELKKRGWRVLRLWEHELRKKREKTAVARLRRAGL
jgi:DNA mismatch endonuclease (patch repair protein)